MSRRLFSCVIALAIIFSVSAFADDERVYGDFTYTIKGNGTAIITKYSKWVADGASVDVFVPTIVDGYTVTEIGPEAFKGIHTGNYGIYKNPSAEVKVVLPNTLKSIGSKAFFDTGITEINIPESVQYIGPGAFSGCHYLHYIVSKDQPYFAVIDKALYSKTNKELLSYSFKYHGEESLQIPEGILSIADYALYECYAYDEAKEGTHAVVLPTSLKRIGAHAFEKAIIALNPDMNFLPHGLEMIGEAAFCETQFDAVVSRGAAIILPSSVKSIGEQCFASSKSLLHIGGGADNYKLSIIFPANSKIDVIPQKAFYENQHNVILYSHAIRKIEKYGFSMDYRAGDKKFGGQKGELFPYASEGNTDYSVFENLEEVGEFGLSHKREKSDLIDCVVHDSNLSGKPFPAKITVIHKNFDFPILIPSTVRTIEQGAFTNPVYDYFLPESIMEISPGAFCRGSTFIVESGSYAELWAGENGFDYKINGDSGDDLDWLNN